MSKLAALEQIVGVVKLQVYAEKYDELELIAEHGEVGIYLNKRTGIKFPSRMSKVGNVPNNVTTEFGTKQKKTTDTQKGRYTEKTLSNQLDLFL